MSYYEYGYYPRYVSVAERRHKAEKQRKKLEKKGRKLSPIEIEGRGIAKTFWGKSWCGNLERYADYENRIGRGRSYVRHGSVIDLEIEVCRVKALVAGRKLYTVEIEIEAVPKKRWKSICKDCSGSIDSLVDLLKGRLDKSVMDRLCRQKSGLFPAPAEISFDCSCPDWASMCKHVAAVLYGIGARLDHDPELLFLLRDVDQSEILANAGTDLSLGGESIEQEKVLEGNDLADLFDIDIAVEPDPPKPTKRKRASRVKTATAKAVRSPAKPAARKTSVRSKKTAIASKKTTSTKAKSATRSKARTSAKKPAGTKARARTPAPRKARVPVARAGTTIKRATASPRRPKTTSTTPAPDKQAGRIQTEALLAAVIRLQGRSGVTAARLAKDLGVSASTMNKMIATLVKNDLLRQAETRPKSYRFAF